MSRLHVFTREIALKMVSETFWRQIFVTVTEWYGKNDVLTTKKASLYNKGINFVLPI